MSNDHGSRLRDLIEQLPIAFRGGLEVVNRDDVLRILAESERRQGCECACCSHGEGSDCGCDCHADGKCSFQTMRASASAPPDELNAQEALFAFMGWLTCFERPVTFSRCHDASPAVELIKIYAAHQGLADVRDGWDKLIVPKAPEPVASAFALSPEPAALREAANPPATQQANPLRGSFLHRHMVESLLREPDWTPQMYAAFNDVTADTTKLLVALWNEPNHGLPALASPHELPPPPPNTKVRKGCC